MAEFSEVMRQARRMCKAHMSCQGCPLIKKNCWFVPKTEENLEVTEECERIIMQWAAEHPEPKYPTWCDWLMEQHMNVLGAIPEVFAKKLDIKPIVGEGSDNG